MPKLINRIRDNTRSMGNVWLHDTVVDALDAEIFAAVYMPVRAAVGRVMQSNLNLIRSSQERFSSEACNIVETMI